MPLVIAPDYDQLHLLPSVMEDWVGPGHPARLVRGVVAELLAEERSRAPEDPRPRFTQPAQGNIGRPAYATSTLLSLWLYGYMNRVRSSRDLEAAARESMGFIWLCGNQAPDHNSLWRFWAANTAALREAFRATVRIALRLNLLGLVLQAIDGTKLQAVASSHGVWDEAAVGALLQRVDTRLAELEAELTQARVGEELLPPEPVLEDLARTGRLREATLEILAAMQAGERQHGHPGEPEAHRVKLAAGGKPLGYNAQQVVDAQARVIIAADVTAESNDVNQALPLMEQAEANTAGGSAQAVSLADGGYATTEALRKAEDSGRTLLCPLPGKSQNPSQSAYHLSEFRYDALTDTVKCPQGRHLPFTRVRERGRDRVPVRLYRSAAICAGCPVRQKCTKDRHGRSIGIYPGAAALERHRQKMARPENLALLKLRKQIVEPVFGWLKSHDGFRRFTYRGVDKVRTQWAVVCAARNLRTLAPAWFRAQPAA